jgi:hypothetical protein
MAEVVLNSTQYFSDSDAKAIGVYLAWLPATPSALQNQMSAPSPAVMDLGKNCTRKIAPSAIKRRVRAIQQHGLPWWVMNGRRNGVGRQEGACRVYDELNLFLRRLHLHEV